VSVVYDYMQSGVATAGCIVLGWTHIHPSLARGVDMGLLASLASNPWINAAILGTLSKNGLNSPDLHQSQQSPVWLEDLLRSDC